MNKHRDVLIFALLLLGLLLALLFYEKKKQTQPTATGKSPISNSSVTLRLSNGDMVCPDGYIYDRPSDSCVPRKPVDSPNPQTQSAALSIGVTCYDDNGNPYQIPTGPCPPNTGGNV